MAGCSGAEPRAAGSRLKPHERREQRAEAPRAPHDHAPAGSAAPSETPAAHGRISLSVLQKLKQNDGLADELLNLLAQIPELRVAARSSSFMFKDKPKDVATMATELHVAHLLEGSVRKAGNRVRITAQLIRADSGYLHDGRHRPVVMSLCKVPVRRYHPCVAVD